MGEESEAEDEKISSQEERLHSRDQSVPDTDSMSAIGAGPAW